MLHWYFSESQTNPRLDASSRMTVLVLPDRNPLHVAIWLFAVCALIYMVIAIGGFTRLTDSGLSIVAWIRFPALFRRFQKRSGWRNLSIISNIQNSKSVNQDMQLDDFKRIYWVEYAHRLAARLVALAFLLPFLYFLTRRYLSRALTLRLVLIFVLGGFQGLLGWYMVASG